MELKTGQTAKSKYTDSFSFYGEELKYTGWTSNGMFEFRNGFGQRKFINLSSVEIIPFPITELIDWDKIGKEYEQTFDISDHGGHTIHSMGVETTFDWFKKQVEKQLEGMV